MGVDSILIGLGRFTVIGPLGIAAVWGGGITGDTFTGSADIDGDVGASTLSEGEMGCGDCASWPFANPEIIIARKIVRPNRWIMITSQEIAATAAAYY